jgi:Skp family chaperone for outer membrane proteins
MKQLFAILTLGLLIFTQTQATAQKNDNDDDRWERYRNEKVAFFTTNLDLTTEEAQKFWPVYNELEKELFDFQQKRHELEDKVRNVDENLSNKELIKLTHEHVALGKTEAEVRERYNEKFLEILPPLKVIKLYKAEYEFRIYMFRKYRDRNREKNDN